jgi:hypothetical protein
MCKSGTIFTKKKANLGAVHLNLYTKLNPNQEMCSNAGHSKLPSFHVGLCPGFPSPLWLFVGLLLADNSNRQQSFKQWGRGIKMTQIVYGEAGGWAPPLDSPVAV